MKWNLIFICLLSLTLNANANEENFANNFNAALKSLLPGIKSVPFNKYISHCDMTAKITDQNGNVINSSCGFSRVGCATDCNDYEVDHLWYSVKQYDLDEELPEVYERIMLFEKPSKALIQIEIDKIMAVAQAKMDWRNRVLFIKDISVLLKRCGNDEINGQSVLNRIYNDKSDSNLALLNCIETEETKFKSETSLKLIKENKIQTGIAIRNVCQTALDLIAGYNVANSLSEAQVDSMQSTFAEIEKSLKSSRPKKAKVLIQAVSVDGTIITEQMKLEVIAILDTILVQ